MPGSGGAGQVAADTPRRLRRKARRPCIPWEFEVFADGTSNPWGCDYDARGNFFVSACVIDHLFHMAPGGLYARQGGAPENPYAYELLPSIVKHKHFRAAYAGVQIYQGGVYPAGHLGPRLHRQHPRQRHPRGSPDARRRHLQMRAAPRFPPRQRRLVPPRQHPDRPRRQSSGSWTGATNIPAIRMPRPIPKAWTASKGRIWRVVAGHSPMSTGTSPQRRLRPATPSASQETPSPTAECPSYPSRESREMDLSKLSTPELVKLLGHSNNWMRRMARRMLVERKDAKAKPLLERIVICNKRARRAPRCDLDSSSIKHSRWIAARSLSSKTRRTAFAAGQRA